jgi:aspartyl protease family protein
MTEPQSGNRGQMHKAGRWMLAAAWLLAIVLLTYYFRDVELDRHNPNRDLISRAAENFAEVVLVRNTQGHYLANGQINGKGVTFLLDTGATWVAVPYELGSELNLVRGMAVKTSTANGPSTSYLTSIDELRLGDIRLTHVKAGLARGYLGPEVLLGMSALAGLELIQRDNTLIIRQYY